MKIIRAGFMSTLLVFVLCLPSVSFVAQSRQEKDVKPKPAKTISELKEKLEKILADSHTPGLSVAIVHRDGPEWVAGLGISNVTENHATTEETLFRIGSVSKAFASMSILKLANEGKLSLTDPVHKLVPEIWFENRWEATDPVRVVHLLEHTTGWDDMHLCEFACDAKGMTLRQGLDYYHGSRYSRWRPGTRMAYCNSGPAVAGYIVEKITGQQFEDYVTQNFFLPIGMKTATYFEQPSPQLTTLYKADGKTPYSYWNILLRPAGSINASAKDMAAYVQFYLNRGSVNGTPVMPVASIERMEIPTSTWEAQQGLKNGYGLSDYVTVYDGFVYHGHNGGVPGDLTEMAYMPEYGVGYFYSINSGNNDAYGKIGAAIRAYITRDLTRPVVPPDGTLPANAAEYAGWYEPDAPRMESDHSLLRLAGMSRVSFDSGRMLVTSLGRWKQPLVPVSGGQFRFLPEKDPAEPIATAMLLAPNADGRFVAVGTTMKQIPAWLAWGQIALTAWFLLSIVGILLYAPFWVLGGLSKKWRRPAERGMRLWPLIAALSYLMIVGIINATSSDRIAILGNLTVWSLGLNLATWLYALAVLMALLALWRARKKEIRKFVRRFSIAATTGLAIAAIYLAYWGMIGLRSWK